MTDLITRLREAIDEDERLARAAVRFGGPPPPHMDGPGVWFAVGMESQYDASVDEHIARHDPARVLREVAAKREILELHQYQYEHPHSYCVSCELNPATTYVRQDGPWCPGVLALAKGYGIEVE